jgi:hypothetical protein
MSENYSQAYTSFVITEAENNSMGKRSQKLCCWQRMTLVKAAVDHGNFVHKTRNILQWGGGQSANT